MKIKTSSPAKAKPQTLRLDRSVTGGGASESPKSLGSTWLTQGQTNIRDMLNKQKAEQSRKFAPEFWLRSGEEKTIRFRRSEPIGSFAVYRLKVRGRFLRITAPPAGERDLFRESGKRASFVALYEVIDIDGYVEKKTGKKVRNVPRFLAANQRLYEQLEAIRAKKGTLAKFNLSIQKTGEGVNTSYVLIPGDNEPLDGIEKIPTIANDVSKYYAPPTLEEQRGLLGSEDEESND